jgi:hypothetical protein
MSLCQCKPDCTKEATVGQYARGHNPASHSKERNDKARQAIQQGWDDGRKRLYGVDNPATTQEVRDKISAALKDKPKSAAHRASISAARLASQACHDASVANAKKAVEANIGSHRSEETKALMSAASKGKQKDYPNWTKGQPLPYPIWNKGLTRETDPRVEAYASKLDGHPLTFGKNRYLYDGPMGKYWMRSTWEVKFAKLCLDQQGYTWEYETKHFYVGAGPWVGESYTPDFYIQELKQHIDVKGPELNGCMEKIAEFRKRYPDEDFMLAPEDTLLAMGVAPRAKMSMVVRRKQDDGSYTFETCEV